MLMDEHVGKHFQAGVAAGIVFFPDQDTAFAVVTDNRGKVFFFGEELLGGFVHFVIIFKFV